jgi:putative addiction module component (TIGR02574 family)
MRLTDIPEIKKLSTSEKILFVEDLWDMISADEDNIPIPQSHKDELAKRLKQYRSNPGNLLSLAELQERIEKRK